MNRFSRKHSILSLVLLIALIAAMALSFVSCDKKQSSAGDQTDSQAVSVADSVEASDESNVVGEGNTSFTFTVVFADKTSKTYTVKTDKTTVGAALIDVGLISGEDSQYGLMVDTVDGVKLEYNTDKMYWAFYVNDGYANSGVDSTEIRPNEKYSFKATAA
jgi:hypothetical protein